MSAETALLVALAAGIAMCIFVALVLAYGPEGKRARPQSRPVKLRLTAEPVSRSPWQAQSHLQGEDSAEQAPGVIAPQFRVQRHG